MPIITLPNDDKARLARVGLTGPDTPITLKDVCNRVFSNTITVATLKAEHQRGTLVLFEIGRQYFTTLNEVNAMMEKCRLQAPPHLRKRGPTEAEMLRKLEAARMWAARKL
jgi:hypothetical protein